MAGQFVADSLDSGREEILAKRANLPNIEVGFTPYDSKLTPNGKMNIVRESIPPAHYSSWTGAS